MGIVLKDITKNYGTVKVFENFSVEFDLCKISCVLGESGSGKTTLLSIVGGICLYDGSVENVGRASYIFQSDRLIENLTVRKNLEYVLKSAEKDKEQMRLKADEMLKKVELYGKKDAYPNQLSGGMRQRLSVARAFIYPSDTLLMDEPFRSLDLPLKTRIIKEFLKLWEGDRRSVIFVTHDIDEALMLSDNIYIIKGSPAQIVKSYKINVPQSERDITKNYFTDIRNGIYNDFLKQNSLL